VCQTSGCGSEETNDPQLQAWKKRMRIPDPPKRHSKRIKRRRRRGKGMRSKEMKNEGRQLGIESCWLSTEGLWHFHPTLTIGIFWMGCQCGLRGRAHAPTHSSWFSPVGSGPSLTIFDGCCLLQPNLMARVTWRQDRILGRGKGRRDLWPNVMPNS